MAALAFTTETTFESGDLVCIDESTGNAEHYDAKDPLPIVGVALLPISGYNPNGRNYFCINGLPYYLNDFYVWEEDLTSDFVTENPSYAPFNPLGDTGYITAITNGIGPLKNDITAIPSSWIKLRTGPVLDWYLIK